MKDRLIILSLVLIGMGEFFFGYNAGKHAADKWWQQAEKQRIQATSPALTYATSTTSVFRVVTELPKTCVLGEVVFLFTDEHMYLDDKWMWTANSYVCIDSQQGVWMAGR